MASLARLAEPDKGQGCKARQVHFLRIGNDK